MITHMLWEAAGHAPLATGPCSCYLCGAKVAEEDTVPVLDRIGMSWTAHDLAADPMSPYLCRACHFCLQEKSDARPDISPKFTFRAYSHLVTPTRWEVIRLSQKRRMLAPLLNPPREPWGLAISTSPTSAPHVLPFTPVNQAGAREWRINFGGEIVGATPDALAALLEPIETLYNLGFSKAELLSGNYYVARVARNLEVFRATEPQLTAWRGTGLFELAVFLSQKSQEEKDESANL